MTTGPTELSINIENEQVKHFLKNIEFGIEGENFSREQISSIYKNYCRPKLGGLLQGLRLDKPFHKAEGDFLYYHNEEGKELKVIDFLGGFGASLFGHNHPELLKVAKDSFNRKLPFNSQLSCRPYAALLAQKLSSTVYRHTGREYVTTLANSGTEAVEAAIKHAELFKQKQVERIHEKTRKRELLLTEKVKNGELTISPQFYELVQERLNLHPTSDINRYLWALKNHNFRIFKIPPKFLSLKKSFHGKTTGSVKFTHNNDFRLPFERIGVEVIFVDPKNIEDVKQAVEDCKLTYFWPEVNENDEIIMTEKSFVNISAMIVEPLQGEGGIHLISKSFLESCRKIASNFDFPLIFDEIQSGMGRTGTFLCSEQQNVLPDYILLSKSLGGGLSKISALMVDSELYEPDFGFIHSSTFAEDDHSSRIALAGLNLLEKDNLMEKCKETGEYLIEGLNEIRNRYPQIIKEIRGTGLMLGIQFFDPTKCGSLTLKMMGSQNLVGFIIAGYLLHEHNIRVASSLSENKTLRIEPSAYISRKDCEKLFSALERLCEILAKQNTYELTKYIVGKENPECLNEVRNYHKPFTPYKRPRNARKVALLTHIILPEYLELFDDSFSQMTYEECCEFIDKVYPHLNPEIYEHFVIESPSGERVDLCWIGIFVDSRNIAKHMMNNDLKTIHDKVEDAVQLAIDNRYTVIGFGGFTSIITKNCTDIKTDAIALTSGNSLTVGMGLEAMHKAAGEENIDISNACVAGIGANGNICSTYCQIMAEEAPKLILMGRQGGEEKLKQVAYEIYSDAFQEILKYQAYLNGTEVDYVHSSDKLSGIAKEIYHSESVKTLLHTEETNQNYGKLLFDRLLEEMAGNLPIIVSTDYNNLKYANIIISASNNPGPIIFPEMLSNDPILINDIAVPFDVDDSVKNKCPNARVINGGIVRLPYNPDFKIQGMPLERGHLYPCQAEAILLGMEGSREHYSYGKITKPMVQKILQIAKIHGFTLGQFKMGRSF